jgi:hypothetical protein
MPTSDEPKVPLLSIAQQWDILARQIFKFEPSTIQFNETRKAFFAGYAAGYQVMMNVSSNYPEDEALAYFEKMHEEIIAFEKLLRAQVEARKGTEGKN